MGLFGDQDAAEVSDNPFYVAPDVYLSILTDLTLRTSKDGEKKGLSFQWTIEEEDNEFNGQTISEWVNVYLSDDDAPDATALRRDRARMKSRLAAVGFSNEQMNELVDEDGIFNEDLAKEFIGTVRYVQVTETPDKNDPDKKYTNITKISDPEAA